MINPLVRPCPFGCQWTDEGDFHVVCNLFRGMECPGGVEQALQLALHPFAGIDKRLDPWSNLLLAAFTWIPCLLPGEDGTLQVGHHGKVTAVGRADAGHVVV